MKIYHIIIIIAGVCITLFYLKKLLLYNPVKASKEKYDVFYEKLSKLTENSNNISNTLVQTSDGISLDTVYLKNTDSDICVIFFHGNAGNLAMRYDMIKFIYNYASVIIFDYRSFGKSDGSVMFVSDNTLQTDSDAIWNYATESLGYSPNKISLFGESMGCSLALSLGAKLSKTLDPNLYLHSVVLNSPFYSLQSMIRVVFDKLRIGHVGYILSMIYGNEYKSNINIQYISHTTKIIIASSIRDEIIPYRESQKLYQLISQTHPDVKFINISGTHNNCKLSNSYIYTISNMYQASQ